MLKQLVKDDATTKIHEIAQSDSHDADSNVEGDQEVQVKQIQQMPSIQPVERPDPLTEVYNKMAQEMEFGTNKQITFKGIVKPVLLNQGSMRSEKIEKTVEQELTNRIRAMVRTGVREMAEVVIRMG